MNQRTVILILLLTFITQQFTIIQNLEQIEEMNSFLRYLVLYSAQTNTDWPSLLNPSIEPNPVQVDMIYYNGTILTMNQNNDISEMLSLKDGKIVWAGSITEVLKRAHINFNKLKAINLEGKTMMPGFYDAHSHITIHSIKKYEGLNLASPPFGNITSIDQIKKKIKQHIKNNNINQNTVIHGSSYSELGLIEQRHPNRFDLDQISKDHIIILEHVSGHIAITNSKGIQSMGVTIDTPNPSGGKIQRILSGPFKGEPTGLFAERAKTEYIDPFNKKLQKDTQSQQIILSGVQDYIEAGVTTAQQGFITESQMDLLLQMKDKLKIDIRGYLPCLGNYLPIFDKYQHQKTKRFQLQGFKVLTDGSIQGYTGYLTDPYYIQPQGNGINSHQNQVNSNNNYRGFPIFEQQDINKLVEISLKRNVDLIAHTNGDAAIDIYIEAVKKSKSKFPKTTSRITAIHAQNVREDQLDDMKQHDIIPSFFVGHTYYWGDQHRDKFLGPKRAQKISPANSAFKKGINFTLHNDAPVTPIAENGIFMIIWSAVNRLTSSGKVLGAQERIGIMQALKSVTIWSAYQGHQQKAKGSLQRGKTADLIILSENPLAIDPFRLKDIKVLQTIKEGMSIYKRK